VSSPATPTQSPGRVRDDLAYAVPMVVFLVFTAIGVKWPALFVASYVVKAILTAALLIAFRGSYTKVRWNYWWLGAIMGVVGVLQWVGMEKLLLHIAPHYPHPEIELYNPFEAITSPVWRWAFIAVRLGSASLLVPVMEELFWRDFAWRSVIAPVDFKLADVGEVDWKAILIVSLIFASVHVQWITALVWGLMIAGLLVLTRSLGACIIMHAMTNFLLGVYVLKTGDWYFW
jgi:CAAX prenyl protease-like protein